MYGIGLLRRRDDTYMVAGVEGTYYSFECGTVINDKCYFVDIDKTELCIMDLKQDKVISNVRIYDKDITRSFSSMLKYGNAIYLIPFNAKEIIEFHLSSHEIKRIPVSFRQEGNVNQELFLGAYLHEGKIYALGSSIPSIMEFDIKERKIRYIDITNDLVKNYTIDKGEKHYFCKGEIIDNILYAPYCKGNAVIRYDIKSNTLDAVEIFGAKGGFSSIKLFNERYWLMSRSGNGVYSTDIKFKNIKRYNLADQDSCNVCQCIDFMIEQNKLQLLGYTVTESYVFHAQKDKFEKIEEYGRSGGWNSISTTDGMFISSSLSGELIYKNEKRKKTLRLKIDGINDPVFQENNIDNLENYITYLIGGQNIGN